MAEFVEYYLDELVDGRTVVLLLSDGLDRGDLAPLQGAMRAIRARARRVLWLNPLAGDRRYEPTARAMAVALPYVDRLLPAHNLESLERLLPLLAA
ncbi:MAG TPA: VWA domain-containing protein [Thermoanaerobaculia bacterium]|nr:VWA domain-containing protein [Thermoanaerobaculia bacterium]